MANEVKILVRVQNSAKAGMDQVNKEVDDFAKKSSDTFASRFTANLTQTLRTTLGSQLGQGVDSEAGAAGDRIGDTIGRRASQRLITRIRNALAGGDTSIDNDTSTSSSGGRARDSRGRFISGAGSGGRVKVDVDVDRQSLMQKIGGLGRGIADKISSFFGQGLTSGLMSVFSGDIFSTIIKAALVAAAAGIIAPAIGAAVSSGVLLALGGGAIGAGIALAMRDPRIKRGFQGFIDEGKRVAEKFGANFKGPLENFLAPEKGGGAGLIGVLRQVEPLIDSLGQKLGPVADKLGQGIIGMLQNLLPAIIRGMEAAIPIVETLAESLPKLGDDIAFFFDEISKSAPDAAVFFNDLIEVVGFLIRTIGSLIRYTAAWYGAVRGFIAAVIRMFRTLAAVALAAWDWVRSVGGRLGTARGAVNAFVNAVRGSLNTVAAIGRNAWNWASRVGARLGGALAAIRNFASRAAAAIRNIPRNIVLNVVPNFINGARSLLGMAHGGVVGQAAAGGPRNGLTWVGEQGPELVSLPPGSRVHTAGDSARMARGGGDGTFVGQLVVPRGRAANRELIDLLMRELRIEIFRVAGGNVQQALGRGAA